MHCGISIANFNFPMQTSASSVVVKWCSCFQFLIYLLFRLIFRTSQKSLGINYCRKGPLVICFRGRKMGWWQCTCKSKDSTFCGWGTSVLLIILGPWDCFLPHETLERPLHTPRLWMHNVWLTTLYAVHRWQVWKHWSMLAEAKWNFQKLHALKLREDQNFYTVI